jgi:hypothetical protein
VKQRALQAKVVAVVVALVVMVAVVAKLVLKAVQVVRAMVLLLHAEVVLHKAPEVIVKTEATEVLRVRHQTGLTIEMIVAMIDPMIAT